MVPYRTVWYGTSNIVHILNIGKLKYTVTYHIINWHFTYVRRNELLSILITHFLQAKKVLIQPNILILQKIILLHSE